MIRRRFIKVKNSFFHYLECGSGFPIILLHESPKSSFAHRSLINYLSKKYKVFALDTPGYGFSDPINKSNGKITDFAKLLNQIILNIKIDKFVLYGNHTGASIALEYGKLFPDKISGLVLESLPIFNKNEIEPIIKKFFSPINIRRDGSHLVSIWSKVEDQNIWFPWYHRNDKKMHHWVYSKPDDIHDYVMDFLRSGDSYRNAYSAAFRYNSFLSVKKLKAPSKFISIKSDILYSHSERLPRLKKNQELVVVNNFTERQKVINYSIKSFIKKYEKNREYENHSTKKFIDINNGQIFYQILKNETSKKPILILIHDLPGISDELYQIMKKLSLKRTVISFDIPGIGNSFMDIPKSFNMDSVVKIYNKLIDSLKIKRYDIYAQGFGGYLSLYLSDKAEIKPEKIILDRVKVLTKKEKNYLIKFNQYNLNIKNDGSHLINTWKMIVSSKIYFPWYNKRGMILSHKEKDFNPNDIHRVFIGIFNNPKNYLLIFSKILIYDPRLFIKNLNKNILIIKDSINVKLSVDKNLNINNTKKNIIIKNYNSERNLISIIDKFLN